MPGIENALLGLRRLDDLALKDSVIHRLTPVVKLLTALVFIVVTVSFPKYDPAALWPMAFYPVVLIILAGLPAGYLLKRLSLTAPFILFIALFNPLFDRATLMKIGPFMVSGGWVSFTVMVTKFALTVLAALILVATSGINEIGSALLKL
ncbi:MAG: energy-coupling factor transporter transmembrane component T family protein, partial [Bacillota bacterium]